MLAAEQGKIHHTTHRLREEITMKFILPLLSISLILAACTPAPQVTVTPEATVTSTPPPTETPLPTLTPTPVAVDGIAEDAEGNKLAYLNGEWTVLPKLDADYPKLMVDGDKVVAVDAEGEVKFEYDLADGKWVEVVREPKIIYFADNAEMRADMEVLMNVEQAVVIQDENGPIPHGFYTLGNDGYYSGYIIGHGDYSESGMLETFLVRMDLENGDTIVVGIDLGKVDGGTNPIGFINGLANPEYTGLKFSTRNVPKIHVKFLQEHGVGRQILFKINPGPGVDDKVRELRAAINGKPYNAAKFNDRRMIEFLLIHMMDEGWRP
jgi:hypothetical protein